MKNFRLAPLPLALASIMAFLPTTHADVPSKGDLEIYTPDNNNKSPKILLMLETSAFTAAGDYKRTDGKLEGAKYTMTEKSTTNPQYTRYSRQSVYVLNKNKQYEQKSYTRLTRMKDAIFYLMDTPDALPDNYQVGVGRYGGGTVVLNNPNDIGDGLTGNIAVPVKELGPVSDYAFAKVKVKGKEHYIAEFYEVSKNDSNNRPFYERFKNTQGKVFRDDQGNPLTGVALDNKVKLENAALAPKGKKLLKVYRYKYVPKNRAYTCPGSVLNDAEYFAQKTNPDCRLTESHRYKIKKYVAEMCETNNCNGQAPMAPAYAEAGAYMMGTKTSRLTKPYNEPDKKVDNTEVSEEQKKIPIKTRVLRYKLENGHISKIFNATWQFCPEDKRKLTNYDTAKNINNGEEYKLYEYRRYECADKDWVNVDKEKIANEKWADGIEGKKDDNNTTLDTKLKERVKNLTEEQRKYDLLWFSGFLNGGSQQRPHGTFSTADETRYSPKTLDKRGYNFLEDKEFQNANPTDTNPGGAPDGWTYLIDKSTDVEGRLQPILRKRVLRRKMNWQEGRDQWQYCHTENAQLVNYIYSSYRYMCKEEDWIDINKDNIKGLTAEEMTWNDKWWFGGRPHKVDTRYIYDPIRNPYTGGWSYYYDSMLDTIPPLPPTLNTFYTTSGIRNSSPDVRVDGQYKYKNPDYSQCSIYKDKRLTDLQNSKEDPKNIENAIFFFTAGWPQSAALAPINEMNMSLSPIETNGTSPEPVTKAITYGLCESNDLPNKIIPVNTHWGCMAEYAVRLRMGLTPKRNSRGESLGGTERMTNPAGVPIKTGIFMFTAPGEELTPTGKIKGIPTYNCYERSSENKSQMAACLLGSYGAGYGEGGFFQSLAQNELVNEPTTEDTNAQKSFKDLTNAFKQMAENLVSDAEMRPTNFPISPTDSFAPDSLLDAGYLPLMAPTPEKKTSQWSGNVRKYMQVKNSYEDKDKNSPFAKDSAKAILRATTKDYWSKQTTPYNAKIQGGGAYERIPMATDLSSGTKRRVYISSATNSSNELVQIKPEGENTSLSEFRNNVKNILPVPSDEITLQRLLLNYMGYEVEPGKEYDSTTKFTDLIPSSAYKSMGGVYHSTPIALTAEAILNEKGKYTPNKQYILFGAMDNAVHIVDNETGVEYMSYFPKEVLATNDQYKAITNELPVTDGETPPAFGVDGPWTAYATYTPTTIQKDGKDVAGMKADKLYTYGGARLGAKAYYGLDLTNIGDNNFTPKQLFTITPETRYKNQKIFNRLGYSWAKPVVTKIKWQGEAKLVVILTGGYDITFDKKDSDFTTDVPETKGNAIYIVDAETGAPLIVASNTADNVGISGASNSDNTLVNNPFASSAKPYNKADEVIPVLNSHLKYSVVSTVKTLDRDSDELVDNIYFTDLNGQVFRLDIDNSASEIPEKTNDGKTYKSGSTTPTNPAVRLVRLANLKEDNQHIGPRFYESPIITVQENDEKQRFVTVSMASGDRSNPLYEDKTTANQVYTIYDKDVGQVNLFNSKPTTVDITYGDLVKEPKSTTTSNYSKLGWSYPLDTFNIVKKVNNTYEPIRETYSSKFPVKALGPMSAVDNRLYVAAYNPADGLYDECTADTRGSSEAYQFCLPYGVCENKTSHIQRIRLGKGIQGIVFGGDGENQTDRQLMTQGTHSAKDNAQNPYDAVSTGVVLEGNGGSSSPFPEFKSTFVFKPVLRPVGWYDLQSQIPQKEEKKSNGGSVAPTSP